MSKRSRAKSTHPSQPKPATSSSPLWLWIGAAVIAVATFVAYLPSLNGAFILDDILLLTDNRLIKAPDGLFRIWFTTEPFDYWPVFNSSLWVEWRVWGMQPTGYHVTNVILHIANALLVWAILRQLAISGAFLAALLFALHPVNVESVAWIAQRKGLLAMLFFLISILWFVRAERQRFGRNARSAARWYWLSVAAFALAMLSKGSAAVLPALLLGIVWWMRPLTRQDLLRIVPFGLVAVVLTGVNVWFQSRGAHDQIETTGFVERLLGAGAVVWFYLGKAVWPLNLAFIYSKWSIQPDRVVWWLPLAAAIAMSAVLWRYRAGWSRAALFAWGFFCVSLVPVMGFTHVTFMEYSLVADHYQYIALVGVVTLIAAGWDIWQRSTQPSVRWLPYAAAMVVCALLGFLTWRQSSLYSDSITLYSASVENSPSSWMAHNNLGAALYDAGRLSEALEHDQRALELNPDYPEAHNNLANVLTRMRRVPEAIEHYREALRLRPTYSEAHNNLGSVLAYSGRVEEGIAHFEQALRFKPDYADAQRNLRVALAMKQNAAAP